MLSPIFTFEGCDQNVVHQGYYHPNQGYEDEYAVKQAYFFAHEDMGGSNDLWSSSGFTQEDSLEKGAPWVSNNQQCFPELVTVDDIHFDTILPPIQSFENPSVLDTDLEKIFDPKIAVLLGESEKPSPLTFSSIELVNNYKTNLHWKIGEKPNESCNKHSCTDSEGRELSTEDVMRVAAAHFIELSEGNGSILNHPFGVSLSGLTVEEIHNIELASLLLAAAEKVSIRQYDRASNLLRQCYLQSSYRGDPVQRVVYYFSDALQERIDRETGRLSLKGQRERIKPAHAVIEALLGNHPVHLVTFKKLALAQLMQFTAIQTILDNMASAKKIHMIDLSIKNGIQWTIMMQTLAMRSTFPVKYLKISAVGTSEQAVNETGQRLREFAESLCLPFYFKAVIVSDMNSLKEDMFMLEEEEAVGVYSVMDMNTMIVRPDRLENVMRVIRKIRPCIMTVADVESDHNSPSFIKRFTESLFFFSAFFDCLDGCMDRDDVDRICIESEFFSEGIRNIIATEGSERVVRHVGLSVWRSYFARFGLVESDLNEWSVYQASLLVKQFVHSASWSLEKNGKSLTIGWKGTPLQFISAWKFH